jgi:hypothetical protein
MPDSRSASLPLHPTRRSLTSRLSARRAARRAAAAAANSASARARYEQLEGRTLLSVSQDADGFTVVTPAVDSKVIYVSSSGNDSNSGSSPAAAVRSIARGKSMLRDGSADQLLFKRGDTFTGSFGIWDLSGRSASEPLVVGTYGEGARPVINTGSSSGLVGGRDAINNVVIQGIHLNASSRDPDGGSFSGTAGGSYGIQSLSPMNNVLIEDVHVENYKFNISIQKFYGPINDITIRRSVVTDANSEPGGGHSSGLYIYGVDGFTLEDNVVDHNGWLSDKIPSAKQTVFNHNAYLKENLTGVTVTATSSPTLQPRPAGPLRRRRQNNLFVNNPVHMSFGLINGAPPYVGGVSGEVSGNVYLGGRDINSSGRGLGAGGRQHQPGRRDDRQGQHHRPRHAGLLPRDQPQLRQQRREARGLCRPAQPHAPEQHRLQVVPVARAEQRVPERRDRPPQLQQPDRRRQPVPAHRQRPHRLPRQQLLGRQRELERQQLLHQQVAV